jgi:hypothetical protein
MGNETIKQLFLVDRAMLYSAQLQRCGLSLPKTRSCGQVLAAGAG